MHNNYFFLRVLVRELRQKLMYARLKQCFSQEKDELVLGFERQTGDDFWIKCAFGSQFSTLQFPESFHRAGRNSVDLFSDLLLAEVQDVIMFDNERAFGIHLLGDFVLVFKLFGNRSNLILFRDGDYQEQFQNRLKKDEEIILRGLDRKIDQSYEAFLAHDAEAFALFPTLGKEAWAHVKARGYEEQTAKARWDLLQEVLTEFEDPSFFIVSESKGVFLHLLPISGELLWEGKDPFEALNRLYAYHYSIGEFNREKFQVLAAIQKAILKTQNYLADVRNQRVILDAKVPFEEIGHILMANLHAIPAGQKEVELYDFYRDKPIRISLNSSLSPAQNAENYYRKSKNFSKELAHWQSNLDRKEQALEDLFTQESQVQMAETRKQLKPFLKLLSQQSPTVAAPAEIPFKEFAVDGWVIWVGKSAKNNDLLTLKYAKKFDLWLHARDVAGSHVIIRNPNQQKVPDYVIEKAAGVAAYFSKRQHDTLCPVIVTPKKYVLKTRDLLAGQVIVDREESVVLVAPALID
jgi:predicted ribosome quality control (RQC) complex YloA/Tae2 family protein